MRLTRTHQSGHMTGRASAGRAPSLSLGPSARLAGNITGIAAGSSACRCAADYESLSLRERAFEVRWQVHCRGRSEGFGGRVRYVRRMTRLRCRACAFQYCCSFCRSRFRSHGRSDRLLLLGSVWNGVWRGRCCCVSLKSVGEGSQDGGDARKDFVGGVVGGS